MKKIKKDIDPENILPKKRQRVQSIDGVWSMITTNQIKGIFYSKKEEKFLKKSQKKKLHLINEDFKKNIKYIAKTNSSMAKKSKKLRRRMSHSPEMTSKIVKNEKNNKKTENHISKEKETATENNTKEQTIIFQKNQSVVNADPNSPAIKKNEKIKAIHIFDPQQRENYLRILQEHIGLTPQTINKAPDKIEFIKIED